MYGFSANGACNAPDVECAGSAVIANRRLNVYSIGLPAIGAICAVVTLPTLGVSAFTVFVFVALFVLNALGAGVGLHRYFSHHAFKTSRVGEILLAVLGTASCQGPIDRWVADHRRHHRFADSAWDPHSPYWRADARIKSLAQGLWHAHIGWMIRDAHVSSLKRFSPEINSLTIAGWASRNYLVICITGIAAPGLVGFAADGANEGLRCLLWAGFFRVALLHQLTWSVNSFGHCFGRKVEQAISEGRNNLILTYLLLGEGLHSTHHKYPTSGVIGSPWKDWNGVLLRLLEKAGLIWELRRCDLGNRADGADQM